MMAPDDLLLPEDAAAHMETEIRTAKRVDIQGSNHYSIMFKPSDTRDRALKEFISS